MVHKKKKRYFQAVYPCWFSSSLSVVENKYKLVVCLLSLALATSADMILNFCCVKQVCLESLCILMGQPFIIKQYLFVSLVFLSDINIVMYTVL